MKLTEQTTDLGCQVAISTVMTCKACEAPNQNRGTSGKLTYVHAQQLRRDAQESSEVETFVHPKIVMLVCGILGHRREVHSNADIIPIPIFQDLKNLDFHKRSAKESFLVPDYLDSPLH